MISQEPNQETVPGPKRADLHFYAQDSFSKEPGRFLVLGPNNNAGLPSVDNDANWAGKAGK